MNVQVGPTAQSLTDGAANTAGIVGALGTSGGSSVGTWYLPAICQLSITVGSGVSAGCSPGQANIDTNLVQLRFMPQGSYWSSTEDPTYIWSAWYENISYFGSGQANGGKDAPSGVRCARSLPY